MNTQEATANPSMIDAAHAMAPTLLARADEIEEARQVPNDLAQSLAEQGFYRMWVPEELGGLAMPLAPSLNVFEILAQGDAAVAWCVAIGVSSTLALPYLPASTARTIFDQPNRIIAGVYAPKGRADSCKDGFRVSGRWPFGSGTRNADWVLAGCRFFRDGEPILDKRGNPRTNMVIVPASQVEFLDTWNVTGLEGTGSNDFKLEDVPVPEAFISAWNPTPVPEDRLYRIPQISLLAVGFGAIALGIARSALSDLQTMASAKTATGQSAPLAQRRDFQGDLARAEVSLRAARSHYYECAEALWDAAAEDDQCLDERASLRLATLHAVEVGAEISRTAYRLGGASSIYTSSRLQRHFRNSHVITQHVQVRPDLYSVIGSHLAGEPKGIEML
ncbi:MAG: acyl-CoA dehydrogenase family protein [Myxococcota bacterium]|jgi:indole-3-acetate monooxygenase|nr:acyl-CoA dehydrogenase family protein [Myxococcota bacterium]